MSPYIIHFKEQLCALDNMQTMEFFSSLPSFNVYLLRNFEVQPKGSIMLMYPRHYFIMYIHQDFLILFM